MLAGGPLVPAADAALLSCPAAPMQEVAVQPVDATLVNQEGQPPECTSPELIASQTVVALDQTHDSAQIKKICYAGTGRTSRPWPPLQAKLQAQLQVRPQAELQAQLQAQMQVRWAGGKTCSSSSAESQSPRKTSEWNHQSFAPPRNKMYSADSTSPPRSSERRRPARSAPRLKLVSINRKMQRKNDGGPRRGDRGGKGSMEERSYDSHSHMRQTPSRDQQSRDQRSRLQRSDSPKWRTNRHQSRCSSHSSRRS